MTPTWTLQNWTLAKLLSDIGNDLQSTPPITIPRCYLDETQIHLSCALFGFCAASKAAYVAVLYLRLDHDCIKFVASKTRVAPLKEQTIPRLELLAALLLVKLVASVSDSLKPELQLGHQFYHSDSQVVLYSIKQPEKEWKPFVQNRVNKIRQLS